MAKAATQVEFSFLFSSGYKPGKHGAPHVNQPDEGKPLLTCPETDLINIILHGQAQELVSLVILDPVKLIFNINHNTVLDAHETQATCLNMH